MAPQDLFGYVGRQKAPIPVRRCAGDDWLPVVVDDWPERVSVTDAELDIFETYFSDFLDELLGSGR